MTYVTTGLTNGGLTAHYQIQYDDSLSQADGRDRANALIAACENDFTLMSNWFGNIALTVSTPITVQIAPGGYASASWGPPITLVPGNGSDIGLVRYLLVSEVVEMFMMAQNKGWFGAGNEGSAGEGLSRFLAGQFLIANGLGVTEPGFGLANSWMISPRADYVNNIDVTDHGIDAKTGCAILFIYYLFTQLGFTINEIIAAAASELSGVYKNLTGDTADPFPFFKQLLDTAFPGTTAIPGSNPDNPWPLGTLSFWVDKSTFGKDEVHDVITPPGTGVYPKAFWVVLDGFSKRRVTTEPTISGVATTFPGISFSLDAAGTEYELPGNQFVPQRIRFPYDIGFSNASLAGFPAGSSLKDDELDASITILGQQFSASTVLEFVGGADPYFTNIDPSQENVFWLSQDLRVFTATPGLNNQPVAGGPIFTSDSVSGAYSYIQQLLTYLNTNYTHPAGADPFSASGILPGQAGALAGDSSVTPTTQSNGSVFNNYNFAVARVRLRGTQGTAGEAKSVKVFFRLWETQTADTDYQISSTYPSHMDSNGLPAWPLPAAGHTLPFFATSNSPNLSSSSNPEYGTSGVNNKTVEITSGDSTWAYYGCFLNVYDPANVVNGQPVQAQLTGTHHCLVAQMAYDGAPVVNSNGVATGPENSDKLAQRNLQVTHSDNPGSAASHRIPQTFDIRLSNPVINTGGDLTNVPDELMIDWGNVPEGSTASVYWPAADATQVLQTASRLYATHQLSAADAHTIQVKTGRGVTYIPIPVGTGENLASLLTIDLPPTVVRGQEFNVTVRRVTTRVYQQIPSIEERVAANAKQRPQKAAQKPVHSIKAQELVRHTMAAEAPLQIDGPGAKGLSVTNWRYVVGTFQVKIPVSSAHAILRGEENTLAIFKWRAQQMAPENRWYPVMQRYIQYLSEKVEALGGNANQILPSPTGYPGMQNGHRHEEREYTGKVCEVIYDCFGDFDGFVLRSCCDEERTFKSREAGVQEVALRACKDHLRLSVFVEHGEERRIEKLVLRS